MPDVDDHVVKRLVVEAVEKICDGTTAKGLKLERLLRDTRVGNGHTRENHFTPALTVLADIAVRTMLVKSKRRVAYERILVTWARTGRERNSLGTDGVKNAARGMRFMMLAQGCGDTLVPSLEIPFTTGTRHDHMNARADLAEIDRLTRDLGRRPNGSPAEHLSELLDTSNTSRNQVAKAAANHRGYALLARHGFSDLIMATSMACGPAPRRGYGGEYFFAPGLDEDFINVFSTAGKRGILHLGTTHPSKRFPLAIVEKQGFRRHQFYHSDFDRELHNDVDREVSWYWHATAHRLLRVRKEFDQGTEGFCADCWYVLGLADDLLQAVALARKYVQTWPDYSIKRWVRDTGLGLVGVSSYRSDVAVRDLLRIGNAAIIYGTQLISPSDRRPGVV
ncbi:MAG TPA: hypothetical protein VGI24_00325 [Solirubrobacteraceae bacterium]